MSFRFGLNLIAEFEELLPSLGDNKIDKNLLDISEYVYLKKWVHSFQEVIQFQKLGWKYFIIKQKVTFLRIQ